MVIICEELTLIEALERSQDFQAMLGETDSEVIPDSRAQLRAEMSEDWQLIRCHDEAMDRPLLDSIAQKLQQQHCRTPRFSQNPPFATRSSLYTTAAAE